MTDNKTSAFCTICGEMIYSMSRLDKPFVHLRCYKEREEAACEVAAKEAYAAEQKARDQAAESLQKQLDHPFYKRVDDFRDEIKQETLLKASEKYPEPFNPGSWSIRQLGKHAMAENYDQGNYIVGLMDAAEELEEFKAAAIETLNAFSSKITELEDHSAAMQKDKEFYEEEANHWRLRAQKLKEELAAITKNIEKGSVIDKRV